MTIEEYNEVLSSANTALSCDLLDSQEKLKNAVSEIIDFYIEEGIIVEENDEFFFCFPYVENEKVKWKSKEDIIYGFLNNDFLLEGYCYNPKSWEYVREMCSASRNTRKEFPDLHEVIFGLGSSDTDFVFSKGSDNHYLYYFNPNSNAGGQIVVCPFDDEMAKRVIDGEDFIEVAAEVTQYLADINHVSFFDTITELINYSKEGKFIGKSNSKEETISLMEKILKKEN